MKLTDKQIIKIKKYISKMSVIEIWEYRKRVSMSDLDLSQANILRRYLDERANKLGKTNALIMGSEFDDDDIS